MRPEQIKNRLATLKNLEKYYDGLLESKYTKKKLLNINKEQVKLRAALKVLGENPIH